MALIGPADVAGFDDAFAVVRSIFEREEERFSRFRAHSELSEVNRRAGRWMSVSDGFADVLGLALEGARASGGLFDPTLLTALLRAGYDRDFQDVGAASSRVGSFHIERPPSTGRWQDVGLQRGRVFVPAGVGLDFGGIAKGWTADLAARSIRSLPWALVDAGGDIRVSGSPPEGGLDVATEDPLSLGTEALRLKLSFGALATSSVTRRRWAPRLHHVIDPRTGHPALTRVLQATAWAETCAEAEVRATWALLAGPAVLEEIPAIVFLEGGHIQLNIDQGPSDGPARAGRLSAGGIGPSPTVELVEWR